MTQSSSASSTFLGSLDTASVPTTTPVDTERGRTRVDASTPGEARAQVQHETLQDAGIEGPPPDVPPTHQGIPDASFLTTDNISDADFEASFFDIDPQIYFADGNNCCGFIPSLSLINDANGPQGPALSWLGDVDLEGFSQPGYGMDAGRSEKLESETSSPLPDSSNEADQETAYLIRYFAERISPCLDVFDIERFFGHIVPIKAIRSPLLQNALAAIAAKQFGKTKRETYSSNHQTPGRSLLEQYSDTAHIDWFYKAASFYDKAIGHMMRLLQTLRDGSPSPSPGTTPSSVDMPASLHSAVSPSFKRRRVSSDQGSHNVVDDLLAAISVFLLYESLDNRFAEVSRYAS